MWWNDIKDIKVILAGLVDRLDSIEDNFSHLNEDLSHIKQIHLDLKTVDKFDDYMKNVDRLNAMVNELKGCVSMARGALQKRKDLDKLLKEKSKNKTKKRPTQKKKPSRPADTEVQFQPGDQTPS